MRQRETGAELDTPSLAEQLRRYRIEAGLTQGELADKAGFSVRTVSAIERGISRAPYPETVRRLATPLDLSADIRATLDRARRRASARTATDDSQARLIERMVNAPTTGADSSVSAGLLPSPLSSFVGREWELVQIRSQLAVTRLLTLTGAGGVGKTRLALEVASQWTRDPCNADALVVFVDLGPLTNPELLPQTVATRLGVHEQPGRPILATLIEALHIKHCLLVLDNCEHLIQPSATLAHELLTRCRDLVVLATSREPLLIGGEKVLRVPSLDLPGRPLDAD
jgi:transcriptional regulator with XRE-family HTH domain